MNKTLSLLLLSLVMLAASNLQAQKIGYIDVEFILNKLPEYGKSQGELDAFADKMREEIQEKYDAVIKLKESYKAEEILLTDDMRKERLDTIAAHEAIVKDMQKKAFGYEGLVFLKRQELIQPLQDKVYEAVEKVCKKKRIQIMFDKSADLYMIYTDTKHDYTDYVMEELGMGDPEDVIDNPIKNFGN